MSSPDRIWVLATLKSLQGVWVGLDADQRRRFGPELGLLIDRLDTLRESAAAADWTDLRRELSQFLTRADLRRHVLRDDGPMLRPPGEPVRGAEEAARRARPPLDATRLVASLRKVLGTDGKNDKADPGSEPREGPEAQRAPHTGAEAARPPKPSVADLSVFPELRAANLVAIDTSLRVDVAVRERPTAHTGESMILPRSKPGSVDLELDLELPAGLDARSSISQPLRVPETGDSATIGFEVEARALGRHELTVVFRQDGIARARLRHAIEVVAAGDPRLPAAVPVSASTALHAAAGPFSGLNLRVEQRGETPSQRYFRCTLRGNRELRHVASDGTVALPASAASMLQALATDLRDAIGAKEVAARQARIQAIGLKLAEGLLPEGVRRALADDLAEGTQLHIESNELWVPWELLAVGVPRTPRVLGLHFSVSRWNDDLGLTDTVRPEAVHLISPDGSGLNTTFERAALSKVADRLGAQVRFSTTLTEVQELLRSEVPAALLHYVGHGTANADDPVEGKLYLQDKEVLRTLDVPTRHAEASTPLDGGLVFLNSCEAGQPSRSLWGHSGWVGALLKAGTAAVMAPSWSVGDSVAGALASRFYSELRAGETIAEAARRARRHARQDGDPDALAYAVYAAPGARLSLCSRVRKPG